jgi:hypothetical protein
MRPRPARPGLDGSVRIEPGSRTRSPETAPCGTRRAGGSEEPRGVPASSTAKEVRSGGSATDELEIDIDSTAPGVPEQASVVVDAVEGGIGIEDDYAGDGRELQQCGTGRSPEALASQLRRVDLDGANPPAVTERERVPVHDGRDDATLGLGCCARLPGPERTEAGRSDKDRHKKPAPHAS